jgi:hypothetical protein
MSAPQAIARALEQRPINKWQNSVGYKSSGVFGMVFLALGLNLSHNLKPREPED